MSNVSKRKVFLSGDLVALEHAVREDGDEPVTSSAEDSDLSLPLPERTLPTEILGATAGVGETHHYLTRIPVGERCQFAMSFPVLGLLNGGQGPCEVSGLALRFVSESQARPLLEGLPLLQPILSEWGSDGRGPLTLALTRDGRVKFAFTGMPRYGYFNLVEHIRGKISDFFVDPKPLHEAWSVSILVSRYPYPMAGGEYAPTSLGLSIENLRHFFPFDVRLIRKELYSIGGRIGIATAWSTKKVQVGQGCESSSDHDGALRDAVKRALWCCEKVTVPDKVFRTDQAKVVGERWREVRSLYLP